MANKVQKYIMDLPETLQKEIWFNLNKHGKIRIVGLGIFEIKNVKSVTSFSPFSGGVVKKRAYKKISYRPYKPLLDFIDKQ